MSLKFRKYLPAGVCMLMSKKVKSFTRHNYESNLIFVIIAHLFQYNRNIYFLNAL